MKTEPASAMLLAALAASLLATAAAIMMIETRGARASSGETLRMARAEQHAADLLAQAIIRLDGQDPMAPQGILFADDAGGRVLRQDAAGLVDINAAAPELLARLFAYLGASDRDAATIADRIADWRDEDDLRRTHGAEEDEYLSAGLAGPANRPFVSEGELLAVMGMSSELAQCATHYLTTYSGASDMDTLRAPPELAHLSDAAVSEAAPSALSLGAVVILTAEAPLSAYAVVRRRIWLRLTGDGDAPYIIHRASQELAPIRSEAFNCAGRAA